MQYLVFLEIKSSQTFIFFHKSLIAVGLLKYTNT